MNFPRALSHLYAALPITFWYGAKVAARSDRARGPSRWCGCYSIVGPYRCLTCQRDDRRW